MEIDHVLQGDKGNKARDLNKASKSDSSKDAGATGDRSKLKTDTVHISEQARTLQRTESKLKTIRKGLDTPDNIRRDKVELARAKIAGGELLIDEVVEGTAEAILSSGALSDIIDGEKLLLNSELSRTESPGASPERLAEIKGRIESGFYETPEVVENIADNIMDDLLA